MPSCIIHRTLNVEIHIIQHSFIWIEQTVSNCIFIGLKQIAYWFGCSSFIAPVIFGLHSESQL